MSKKIIAAGCLPSSTGRDPEFNCAVCPRLADFRAAARLAQPDWYNAPVPTFGALDARLLVVGLAPGLRGANRTGRPFTGDFAGDLLYTTLQDFKFASGRYDARADDGLQLVSCAITNAVRCVPPQNKPAPAEINNCRAFLAATISAMPALCAIVALGRVAHESVVRAFGLKLSAFPFAHGSEHVVAAEETSRDGSSKQSSHQANAISLFSSYHCSRYNTNTGVLTPEMFRAVFARAREHLAVRAPMRRSAVP